MRGAFSVWAVLKGESVLFRWGYGLLIFRTVLYGIVCVVWWMECGGSCGDEDRDGVRSVARTLRNVGMGDGGWMR